MVPAIPFATLLAWSWDDLSWDRLSSDDLYTLALGGIPLALVVLGMIGVMLAMRPRRPRPH